MSESASSSRPYMAIARARARPRMIFSCCVSCAYPSISSMAFRLPEPTMISPIPSAAASPATAESLKSTPLTQQSSGRATRLSRRRWAHPGGEVWAEGVRRARRLDAYFKLFVELLVVRRHRGDAKPEGRAMLHDLVAAGVAQRLEEVLANGRACEATRRRRVRGNASEDGGRQRIGRGCEQRSSQGVPSACIAWRSILGVGCRGWRG